MAGYDKGTVLAIRYKDSSTDGAHEYFTVAELVDEERRCADAKKKENQYANSNPRIHICIRATVPQYMC